MGLLVNVANAYRQLYPTRTRFLLDYEYKKEGAAMVVKQVRPLPLPNSTTTVVPFLIDEPATHCVFQGEYADCLCQSPAEVAWTLRTRNLRLTDAGLQQSFYADSQLDYLNSSTISRITGPFTTFPEAAYTIVIISPAIVG
jgi:hypothetical protein